MTAAATRRYQYYLFAKVKPLAAVGGEKKFHISDKKKNQNPQKNKETLAAIYPAEARAESRSWVQFF